MPTLRALRLLNAVEAGTVTGTQLQTYLTDTGRVSEFSSLLSSRGQSRRMAGSTLTMAAIASSLAATNIVFKAATTATSAACQAVVASPIAMVAVAASVPSLNVLGANSVSWGLFNTSAYYETNIKTVIANFAGVTPANYATIDALIADSVSMAAIAAAPYAMNAVVASSNTTTLMATSSAAMALVASNAVAIDIVAKQTSIMGIVANSTQAMTEINSRSTATNKMASYPGAIVAISSVTTAWSSYMAGPYFATNLALALANLIGVSPITFPTLSSIIADATALGKVAINKAAVQALASNSAAMSTLATSSNIGIILGSSIAMAVIGPNTTAMSSFLGSSGAWAGLFASSVAKGYIVSSTALVDAIAANSALLTYLGTLSKITQPATIPDGLPGTFQNFDGTQPTKVLVLSAKEVGIAATYSDYKLSGTSVAGSAASVSMHLSSTAWVAGVAGYTGLTWDLLAAGVTAATLPIIKYVDMT